MHELLYLDEAVCGFSTLAVLNIAPPEPEGSGSIEQLPTGPVV